MNARDDTNREPEGQQPRSTRVSRAWLAAFVGLVLLLIAIVFIAQNGDDVAVEFLAWEGTISLGLALLLAAVLGGLVVFSLGAARMVQLRRAMRRHDAIHHGEPSEAGDRVEEEHASGDGERARETERERT